MSTRHAVWALPLRGKLTVMLGRRMVAVAVAMAVMGWLERPVAAQDPLEDILVKASVSNQDRARVAAEVAERAKRLVDAKADPERRASARQRLTNPYSVQGLSAAWRDAYPRIVAQELTRYIADPQSRELGQNCAWILIGLNHAGCAPAFAAGLRSPFPEVRYLCARGIEKLHEKLKDDAEAGRTVLRALGDAGAAETHRLVLYKYFDAIDFPADAGKIEFADACAEALGRIYEVRLARLAAGHREHLWDPPSFAVAESVASQAGDSQRVRLMVLLLGIIQAAAEMHVSDSVDAEYRPALAGVVNEGEAGLRRIMTQAGKSAPSQRISQILSGNSQTKTADLAKALNAYSSAIGG